MQTTSTDVRAFHNKHGFPCDLKLAAQPSALVEMDLAGLAASLHQMAQSIEDRAIMLQELHDERLYRTWLMIEEAAEIIQALADKNEEDLADGTADLRYVLLGTDLTYGIPSEEVDHEVHISNMSKESRSKDSPMYKGPNYKKPNILEAIKRGRLQKAWNDQIKRDVEDGR